MTYEDILSIRDSSGVPCQKKRFTTSRPAIEQSRQLSRRGRIETRVYRCERCGKYHITTTNIWAGRVKEHEGNVRITGYDIEMINKQREHDL